MGLDYSHTCPDINRAINEAKDTISSHIEDIVNQCSPLLEGDPLQDYVKSWTESLYGEIKDCFEVTRKTNEDMREEADRQIDDLVDEVDSLKDEINEFRQKMLKLVDPKALDMVNLGLETDGPYYDANGKEQNWELHFFHNTVIAAVMPILNKIILDVYNAEFEVVNLMHKSKWSDC